ncbi:glucose-6-phosphate isomerase [Comamonas sp. GB3 AK4-5]|uniref:glucose-6-phosphate isomerase n=1 Tax=Comamonas sp. GB3 AK4-5 TaxID=3231487 RepID=UPI00351DFAFF
MQCNQTAAWQSLAQLRVRQASDWDIRQSFASDSERFDHFSQQAPHVFADLSKNAWDGEVERRLMALARECRLEQWRSALFAGDPINATEHRAAMHWLLRMPADGGALAAGGEGLQAGLQQDLQLVHHTLDAMLALAEQVRADAFITDVVNIGIGGSHLGPEVAVNALEDWVTPGKRFHFVSNVDGHELGHVLDRVDPQHTLFIIASKSFTTAETMLNARSAREWFVAQLQAVTPAVQAEALARHFVALTTNVVAAAEFGIRTSLPFWDWVGGRYSLWSAIGLPVAIAVGAERFREMLAGAHAMDAHFVQTPLERNLPVRLALLDVWYRNFMGYGSRCMAAYSHGLRRLPAYLQQLEMESNGKGVDREGQLLGVQTSAVVWGEPGTNGQHAFFQMLHQGQDVVPVEFIALRDGGKHLGAHHRSLVINAVAQAQALLMGRYDGRPEQFCPGNRPSSFLLLERLDPAAFGALVALYEHRVFCSGVIWGINSFDQWGVELGKLLAQDLQARMARNDWTGVDASTAALLHRLLPEEVVGASA